MIVTGTGDAFCDDIDRESFAGRTAWEPIYWEGKRLLKCLLEIDVPVIGAINGPAFIHAEVPLLADIVVAADTAALADKAHFSTGSVPSDGVHLVWPYLLGPRRAKYFLMTNQEISASEALQLGVVNEVVPAAQVHERAWELARGLAENRCRSCATRGRRSTSSSGSICWPASATASRSRASPSPTWLRCRGTPTGARSSVTSGPRGSLRA